MPYFRLIFAVLVVFSFLTVARGTEPAADTKKPAKKAATKKTKKAKAKKQVEDSGMYVESNDPNADLSEFRELGYQVIEQQTKPDATAKVPTDVRDKLLTDAGLTTEVAGWDNFERDVFTLRSEVQPFERMRTWYPLLSDKKIKAHQELVTKWRNGQ